MKTTRLKQTKEIRNWLDQFDPDRFLITTDAFRPCENCLVDDSGQGYLSFGLPPEHFCTADETANDIFWFPGGVPAGTSVLVASSRIGNQPDTKPGIFDAIRTLACRLNTQEHFLITHAGIATDIFVSRAAVLFDLPIVEFIAMPTDIDSNWFGDVLISFDSELKKTVCYYHTPSEKQNLQVDQLLISVADEVRLLSVRSRGNILTATSNRLASRNENKTYLLVDNQLTQSRIADELQQLGALPWWLFQNPDEEASAVPSANKIQRLAEFKHQQPLDKYLIHWTRRRRGPWPGQSENQFWDDLILGLPSRDHTRIATLCRIVATRILLASNTITRDSTPVVCFSEQTVDDLLELRTFRSHLSRWDFELVGIAIRRKVLESLNGQPVIYGTSKTWEELPQQERPFFQIEKTENAAQQIDWTDEKEWRVVGNIDLSTIGPSDAFVFVETEAEAQMVAGFSRWPIVIIESAGVH